MEDALIKAHIVGGDARRGESQQLPEEGWGQSYAAGEVVEPPYSLTALAELYEINSTHKACVDAKTTNIVGLGYRFVPVRADADEREREELERLFGACNPEMTFTEVMRAAWTDVETIGNGYLEITRNGVGEVDGFYHVPATTVRVRPDRRGFVQMRDGRKRRFRALGVEAPKDEETGETPNEILHFRKYTPQSTYYGVPDILPAVSAVAGDRAAAEYNVSFFEHNAVPRMAVIVEGGQMSKELLRQLRRFMETEIKGQAHKTLVLEVPGGGTKLRLERLSQADAEDAAFLDFRRANRDEILMVHRVPPSKITIVENANLANSTDQDKTFREQVVGPEQRRIEFQLNRLIREQIGIEGWEFRFREMDLTEELQQAQIAKLYAGIGVWTADEIRARRGCRRWRPARGPARRASRRKTGCGGETMALSEESGRFAVTMPLGKVWEDEEGELRFEGVASSTRLDRQQERMTPNAIRKMAQYTNLDLLPAHGAGPLEELGVIEAAWADNDEFRVAGRLDRTNPAAQRLFAKVLSGKRYGLSVGGRVIRAFWRYDEEAGREVRCIDDVELDHVAVCRPEAAANPDTYLAALAKAADRMMGAARSLWPFGKGETEDEAARELRELAELRKDVEAALAEMRGALDALAKGESEPATADSGPERGSSQALTGQERRGAEGLWDGVV